MKTVQGLRPNLYYSANETFGKRMKRHAWVIVSRIAMGIAEGNRIHAAVEAKKLEAWQKVHQYGIPNRFH